MLKTHPRLSGGADSASGGDPGRSREDVTGDQSAELSPPVSARGVGRGAVWRQLGVECVVIDGEVSCRDEIMASDSLSLIRLL